MLTASKSSVELAGYSPSRGAIITSGLALRPPMTPHQDLRSPTIGASWCFHSEERGWLPARYTRRGGESDVTRPLGLRDLVYQ